MGYSALIITKRLQPIMVVAVLFFALQCSSQSFSKRFEFPVIGSGNAGHGIEKHEQGYLIYHSGNTGNASPTGQHAGLLLVDEEGNVLNETNEGAEGVDYFCGRSGCSDSFENNFVVSLTKATLESAGDAFLREFDSTLNMTLEFERESDLFYNCTGAIYAQNGGYAACGSTRNTSNGTLGLYILKLDSSADMEWETVIPANIGANPTELFVSNIINAHDGGYLVTAGKRYPNEYDECVFINYKRNGVLYKFSSQGGLEWTREWDNCYNEGPFNILATSDGNYVLSQATVVEELAIPQDYIPWRLTLIKIDSNGNDLWEKAYSSLTGLATLRTTIELDDGSLVAVGQQFSNPNPNRNAVILKTSAEGDSLWMRTHQWEPGVESIFRDVIEDGEGGFVATGYVRGGEGYTGQDTWVVRMDSLGCIQGDCGSTSISEVPAPPMELNVYPNPASDQVTIDINSALNTRGELLIFNSLGQMVSRTPIISGSKTVSYDASLLSNGIYIFEVRLGDAVLRKKVMIEKG